MALYDEDGISHEFRDKIDRAKCCVIALLGALQRRKFQGENCDLEIARHQLTEVLVELEEIHELLWYVANGETIIGLVRSEKYHYPPRDRSSLSRPA